MHNSPEINILSNISRKAAKILMRDYFELENIQSSPRGAHSYANKSKNIVQDLLIKELSKAYPNTLISLDDIDKLYQPENQHVAKSTTQEQDFARILINPLDGEHNLARSLPFFAFSIMLQIYEKSQFKTNSCLINSSYLGLTYYATKGRGAWLEKIERGLATDYRMRVSSNITTPLMFGINNAAELNKNREAAKLVGHLNIDVRIIGSDLMLGALVASGKLDASIFFKPTYNNLNVIKLLVSEAGGILFNIRHFADLWIACSAAQYQELFKHFNA